MVKFTSQSAADYDTRIATLVPGYGLAHDLVAIVLRSELGDEARILVAGAGTGTELLKIAACAPGWRLTAVDTSEAMLEVARQRTKEAGCAGRIDFHVGDAAEFAAEARNDAAVAVLVTQFVPDDGARLRLLGGLSRNLNAGAPLVLVDLAAPTAPLASAYRHWALENGVDGQAADAMLARVAANFHPLSGERLDELLCEAGFGRSEPFFRALAYAGVVARRSS